MPVGDELATDFRRVSGKVHVETRDGRSSATRYGTRLVEFGEGCEVVVKIPCVPEKALMVGVFVTPRPGVPLRETWGWKPLLHTPSSGVWVLSGALQSIGFLDFFGCGCLLGWSQHLPHSLGGMSLVRLPMLVFLRARPSYRATHWTRLLAVP